MSADRKRWLDDPRNVRRLYLALWVVCILLVVIELLTNRHAHSDEWPWEGWPAFYGIFGFVAFFLIVMAGRAFRLLVKRDEDYYDG